MITLNVLQPSYVRLRGVDFGSLIEKIILASSNSMRLHMGLAPEEMLASPVPKFVTRKHPSLDNYFADLLLRSSYEPVDYLPGYEEHVMRGSQDELPTAVNGRLAGSVLIGIGGRSSNPDFVKVYDEHSFSGTRTAPSASQVVFAEHLDRYTNRPGVGAVGTVLREINSIDSKGGASYDHLYNILKSLNVAEFVHPGFVFEPLHPQWKRAVVEACLCSVSVAINDFERYDIEQATKDLEREWETYLTKIEKRIKYGFPDKIIPAAVQYVKRLILQPKEPEIDSVRSYLTVKRILFALRHSWHPSVVAYLLEFIFEAMRQSQQSFEEIRTSELQLRRVNGDYAFVYYRQEPKDRLPHRGLLANMNGRSLKGLLVVFNPSEELTAIFGSKHLPKKVWRSFVKSLLDREGDSVWYVPTAVDGSYANFILNGTVSYCGVPKTSFSEQGLLQLFGENVAASDEN